MKCENLFIVPVWMVWCFGVLVALGIVNYALEIYLNAQKRKAEKIVAAICTRGQQ